MYLRMNAFYIVRLPPLANVPAFCTCWANVFATTRAAKMAMPPFAE